MSIDSLMLSNRTYARVLFDKSFSQIMHLFVCQVIGSCQTV